MQLICVEPIMTRPNYYVVRVDSQWELSNWYEGEREQLRDHLDDIYDAIEEQFGSEPECECDYVGKDQCESCNAFFPTPFLNDGCSWGEIEISNAQWDYVLHGANRRAALSGVA